MLYFSTFFIVNKQINFGYSDKNVPLLTRILVLPPEIWAPELFKIYYNVPNVPITTTHHYNVHKKRLWSCIYFFKKFRLWFRKKNLRFRGPNSLTAATFYVYVYVYMYLLFFFFLEYHRILFLCQKSLLEESEKRNHFGFLLSAHNQLNFLFTTKMADVSKNVNVSDRKKKHFI